jgi:hypothetical protein
VLWSVLLGVDAAVPAGLDLDGGAGHRPDLTTGPLRRCRSFRRA